MRRNAQFSPEFCRYAGSLIQHVDEIRVFKDNFNLLTGEQIFHVLRDACRDAAPFAEALPDFHGVGRRLFLTQQQMKLVHVVSGGFAFTTVCRDTTPYLILHNEHTQLFQLLAQLLDVIADHTIIHVHVGSMVKYIQRTGDIDFKGGSQRLRFLFSARGGHCTDLPVSAHFPA